MTNDWKSIMVSLLLLAGCGCQRGFFPGWASSARLLVRRPVTHPTRSDNRFFGVIEGALSDSQPTASHQLRLDPNRFTLPAGKVLLRLTVEHEREQSVRLFPGDVSKVEVVTDASGLLVRLAANDSFEVRLEGLGAYHVLVSLVGDRDGDGDVDGVDLARAGSSQAENLGVSTLVRPLDVHFGLDPRVEPLAGLQESVKSTASFLGHTSPGSTVFISRGHGSGPGREHSGDCG